MMILSSWFFSGWFFMNHMNLVGLCGKPTGSVR